MPEEKFSGITLNDKPIEFYLEEEKSKEIRLAKKEEKYYRYHHSKLRYPERRERNGKCIMATQQEINIANISANITQALNSSAPPRQVIIACLITGREYTIEKLVTILDAPNAIKSAMARLEDKTVFGKRIRKVRRKDQGSKATRNYFFLETPVEIDFQTALEESMTLRKDAKNYYRKEHSKVEGEEGIADKILAELENHKQEDVGINLQNPDAPLKAINISINKLGSTSQIEISLQF